MSPFTPGPWVAAPLGPTAQYRDIRVMLTGEAIASVTTAREASEANARLIAAAPDMFATLRTIRGELADRYDGAPDSKTQWMAPWLEALDAAIRGAGGKP